MIDTTFQLIEPLTDRELEVLQVMAQGKSNQEIANVLHIGLTTVKWYNSNIYSKLGVSNREEAITRANALGLFNTDETHTDTAPNNLPQENTPFVGRIAELESLQALLNQAETRLITIIAQGGMGKTRLVQRLAQANLQNYADGVYLISLASLESETMVPGAVASVLGLQSYDKTVSVEDSILKYLQSQHMLLIFDNFEHVLGAGTLLSQILQHAPRVKIITTSRERLNLQGEAVYVLSGMHTPDGSSTSIEVDSVRMFVQSARRVRIDYEINDYDLPYIEKICQLVDGLPLGIELAAGWMDTLSAEKLAEEIQKSIDILETDLRDIPERHRSIRATFDHTWQYLSDNEKNTMMRLSIFRGGFTQEAAEFVADANVRRLKRLVNQSLLHCDVYGRYTIHELLRQFCAHQLNDSGEFQDTLEKYIEFFADYTAQQMARMRNFDGVAFDQFAADWDNVAYTWTKVVHYERYTLLKKMIHGIFRFSSVRGYSYECTELFDMAILKLRPIAEKDDEILDLFVRLLVAQSDLMTGIATEREVRQYASEAIEILEEGEPSELLLEAYSRMLYIWSNEDFEQYGNIAKKIIDIGMQTGIDENIAFAHAVLWNWNQYQKDTEAYQHSLNYVYQMWKTRCNEDILAVPEDSRWAIGDMLRRLGKHDEAKQFAHEQLLLAERIESLWTLSNSHFTLMEMEYQEGNITQAKRHIAAVLHWHRKKARDWQTIGTIQGVHGSALMFFGDYARAIEACSFALNHPVTVETAKIEARETLENARKHVDEATFNQAQERGKSLTLQEMFQEALEYWTV